MKITPRAAMHELKNFERLVFQNWGFGGIKDYLGAVFGFKFFPFFSFQLLGTALAGFIAWFAEWIWDPPLAAVLILGMTLVNARYGYLVSKKIKKQPFSFSKFNRTFSIMISDLLVMAIIHTAIRVHGYYEPLADILFGWFFTNKLRQILYHMALLKLQSGTLAAYLRSYMLKLIQSKIGENLVETGFKMENIKKKKRDEGGDKI